MLNEHFIIMELECTYETKKVETAVTFLCAFDRVENLVGLVEGAFLDGLINAYNVLPDNATSTNVQVTIRSR